MLIASLCLGEEISNLDLSGKVVKGDNLIMYRAPSKVRVDANVLGQLILDRIDDNLCCHSEAEWER